MEKGLKKSFSYGGLRYVAHMSVTGEFSFELTGGATKKGTVYNQKHAKYDLWYGEDPIYNDVNLNADGLAVLRLAGDILVDWVYAEKPWRIGFSASTDRKTKIYRWLAKKLAKKLPGYTLTEWPEGAFNFYRNM